MASDQDKQNETSELGTRQMGEQGYAIVVTRAFGPEGEDLMDPDGPRFSGAPGVKLLVRQGDVEGEVILSPVYGDPQKIHDADFEPGQPCELICPSTGNHLDKIPGMSSEGGGEYFAIYLTPKLGDGELVAINNVWGNTNSRMMSEDEMLLMLADSEAEEHA